MKQPTKAEKKQFRKLAALAHERELGNALEKLLLEFERWKKGEINTFELNDKIHEHHDGTARDLFKFYVYGDPQVTVARAVAEGVLEENEIDERFLPFLKLTIENYRKKS